MIIDGIGTNCRANTANTSRGCLGNIVHTVVSFIFLYIYRINCIIYEIQYLYYKY